MSLWRRKPDPFRQPTTTALGIDDIIKSQANHGLGIAPKQNRSGDIPYNSLVYALHALGDIYNAVPIHREVVELIQRRMTPFSGDHIIRQEVILNLIYDEQVHPVNIWVIPIFDGGALVHYIFAATQDNQQLLLRHRYTEELEEYDITSL